MSAVDDFSASVKALMDTMLASIPDPADSIRIFSKMASYFPEDQETISHIGEAENTMQQGMAEIMRRSAVVAMAQASSLYQPTSYDDAERVRKIVCDFIQQEIDIAGDEGADSSFLALKSLRAAVVRDLTSRGASLARLVTVKTGSPMPALTLAWRLYQDTGRTDEIIASGDPPHPAFMPTSFRALSA